MQEHTMIAIKSKRESIAMPALFFGTNDNDCALLMITAANAIATIRKHCKRVRVLPYKMEVNQLESLKPAF